MLDDTDDLVPESFSLISENSYVAVFSSENSFELFYIIKVIDKCVALEDEFDIYGHVIQSGSEYCKGYYLEKVIERGEYVQYKIMKKLVYFYAREVFSPSVPVGDNLTLSISVHLSLAELI